MLVTEVTDSVLAIIVVQEKIYETLNTSLVIAQLHLCLAHFLAFPS